MRSSTFRPVLAALAAGGALLLSGCGDRSEPTPEKTANSFEGELVIEQGNDLSAQEMAAEDMPAAGALANTTDGDGNSVGAAGTEVGNVIGETSGGDTGGNAAGDQIDGR